MIELMMGNVYTFPVFAADAASSLGPVKIDRITPKRSKSVRVEVDKDHRSVTLIPLAVTRRVVRVWVMFDNASVAYFRVAVR